MKYKILHLADLNLDASFAGQNFPIEFGYERRLGLHATLTRILSHARDLKVNAITIGGNFLVQEYFFPESADFIVQQFSALAPIRVIIAPGARDPYTNESTYARLAWPENVDIFYQGKLTHLALTADIHLWGACTPPVRGHNIFDDFRPANGINILLLHARQERSSNEVHVVDRESIRRAGFQCALLGGDPNPGISQLGEPPMIYPGSPEPLAPMEENDLNRVAVIEIDGEKIDVSFLSVQQWHYATIDIDLTNCQTNEEVEKLISNEIESICAKTANYGITIRLMGKLNPGINLYGLHIRIESSAFYRLESHLRMSYDLEQLAREQTVRGLLVQRFQERIKNSESDSERSRQLTALNFALQALDGKQVNLYEIESA